MKPFAERFYKSRQWIECRKGYLTSVFGICERCERPALIVHHKIELTPENINDPEISLNWENLEALCQDCHNKEHHGSDWDVVREDVMFDEYGNLVESKPKIV